MPEIMIYRNKQNKYESLVCADDKVYSLWKAELLRDKLNILIWEKERVDIRKIEDSRAKRKELINRLNSGEDINLKSELLQYFL